MCSKAKKREHYATNKSFALEEESDDGKIPESLVQKKKSILVNNIIFNQRQRLEFKKKIEIVPIIVTFPVL